MTQRSKLALPKFPKGTSSPCPTVASSPVPSGIRALARVPGFLDSGCPAYQYPQFKFFDCIFLDQVIVPITPRSMAMQGER